MGKIKRGIEAYKKTMEKDSGDTSALVDGKADGSVEGENRSAKRIDIGLLKTGTAPSAPPASKARRAAQFMVLIGSDEAAKVLSQLDPEQVNAISKEIVSIKTISREEAAAVLQEFRSLLSLPAGSGASSGGLEQARKVLHAAFGAEKGEAMLVSAVPDAKENPFNFLSDFSGEQLAVLFKGESPAACAMVFSRLPAKLAAQTLANISPDRKFDIVKRIARLKESAPDVIERTAAALKEKARHFGRIDSGGGEIDGKGVLAAILKQSDTEFGGRLLDVLEKEDPTLSRDMKERLYTLEDIVEAADRPIQEKLREMGDKDIVLLLRGRSEEFTQKIMRNISSVRAARIKEESDFMGAIPKIEAEAAAREFLEWFRQSREEGSILMLQDKDVVI
ncbi:MAG: flagellar motor switch protein FliG [Treponema sp.]|nr:flagellar motor switch protein FliG [Treponema sp.]